MKSLKQNNTLLFPFDNYWTPVKTPSWFMDDGYFYDWESFVNTDPLLYATSNFENEKSLSLNTTDSKQMNEQNNGFYRELEKEKEKFINIIHHSDFEDGCENDVIRFVQKKVSENAAVTINWLAAIYSNYKRIDEAIVIAILRTFAYIKDDENFIFIEAVCMLIIESALHSQSVGIQEAALVVVESLRTKPLYEIAASVDFSESILQHYAEGIVKELKKELGV